MRLSREERYALSKLFQRDEPFSHWILARLDEADVLKRERTGIGFFSTIRFPSVLPESSDRPQWDWNFVHKKLSHGGSFICWVEGRDTIGLEAVSHYGDWPAFNEDDFAEQ